MPPRIQSQLVSGSFLPYVSPSTSTSSASSTCISKVTQSCSSRSFSSSPAAQTRLRNEMFSWLNGEGVALKQHTPGRTNYVSRLKGIGSNRPFPLNPNFVSEPILSEELRKEIYRRVVDRKQSVRAVSVDLGVDMRRVAAVVRLVELEKRWKQQGKSLALPYARAVHEMVPTTQLRSDMDARPHESINDLPVHRLTDPQIFYPVSESRQFTRMDAGRVFSAAPALPHEETAHSAANPAEAVSRITQNPSRIERVGKGADEHEVLQPADARIPHPHLVAHERQTLAKPNEHRENMKLYRERLQKEEKAEQERKSLAKLRAEQQTVRVQPDASRFEFRIKDVVVSRETTGPDGRGARAPGRRYGVPTYDRKKGQVKIPTRVEV
ncbi:mitochondrial 37S ribosomal protein mS45 [Aspergillus clavatus NRRL 1]|uniref:37S ribosomal protein S35, mitochondrial n=1 Tax=Aspergillus clavatus (strain ATCC 1007 / CBS 513.65 / DSM 816 / NCTC 3887 / NRRL 1 / QM 1276 / 107) TaxID=344612 RepID=A1CAL9_ASPCL|nr:uncharacterized protein ACLA_012150 [Aspergillus clavatus NRRL 1]EAW12787.1 conserved hypothetical protein [Aspergillus clavatus NRRL 1]